jgi:hypothetical protein
MAMTDDDVRDDDEGSDKGLPIAVVIAVAVVVILFGSLVTYVDARTSGPPAGPGTCNTACTAWVKVDCPGGQIVGTCSAGLFGTAFRGCGPPVHTCGVNPPPPP